MTARRRPAAFALVAAVVLAGGVFAAALIRTTGNEDRSFGPPPRLLRVTAGDEIATGFAVGGDRVVTVAHVLTAQPAVTERPAVNGVRARVLSVDRRSDLVLLSVPALPASARPAIAPDSPSSGDPVRVLRLGSGHISQLSGRVRRAVVAHVRVDGAPVVTRPALELAGRVQPGDSGAPVVSDSGAIAGVIFAASSRIEDTAYAVDASALARLLAGR
jgi:hypothetical protein